MAVFHVNKTKNYTVMSNTHLRDMSLSLKAKGLLSMMLSLPDDWDYSIGGLCAICTESDTAIRSALKELEQQRYLVRTRHQDEQGKFSYTYEVYEQPYAENPHTDEPCADEPHTDEPHTENPYTENRHTVRTPYSSYTSYTRNTTYSKQNTDKQSTEEPKKENEKRKNGSPLSPSPSPQGNSERENTDAAFAVFWEAYPRKVGKQEAARAFARIPKSAWPLLLPAIEAQKTTRQWQDAGGRYIPHPATWLNRGSWEDEVEPCRQQSRNPFLAALQNMGGDTT